MSDFAFDDEFSTDLDAAPADDAFALDFEAVALQLVAPTPSAESDDLTKKLDFVEKIARGHGPTDAGLAVGWSIAKINRTRKDPEIIEILDTLAEYKNDTVEHSILRSAQAGNVAAQKMWANAKMPDRGWVDKKTHVIEGQAQIDVVHSVKQALQDTLRQPGAIAGLHAAYADDDIIDLDDDFGLED